MTPVDMPSHGTRPRYRRGCTCTLCRAANSRYVGYRKMMRDRGATVPYVDAEPVRVHVRQLQAAGTAWERVTYLAGVSQRSVQLLLGYDSSHAPSRRVLASTARALLAVEPDPLFEPAEPLWRLVHGMVAAGYPMGWIGRQLGQTRGRTVQLGRRVSRRNAERIRALAELCAIVPGPSERARRYATCRGWQQSWLWDDLGQVSNVEADDAVDQAAVLRACDGDLTVALNRAERREVVRRLTGRGLSLSEIADRVGANQRLVERDRALLQRSGEKTA